MPDQKKDKRQQAITLIAVVIGIFIIASMAIPKEAIITKEAPTEANITKEAEPITWDMSEEVKAMKYTNYTIEESDFDYSDPLIQEMAKTIKTSTATPEEAVKRVLKLVASTIKYDSEVTVNECYNEKASTVVKQGTGDCVSMARTVTALLRAQGIPTRTKGGCLSMSKRCVALFATIPTMQPQTTPMVEDDFKKRGFMHEWVEAWYNGEWHLLEPTSGQVFDSTCVAYLPYNYDNDQYSRCTINNREFWNICKLY